MFEQKPTPFTLPEEIKPRVIKTYTFDEGRTFSTYYDGHRKGMNQVQVYIIEELENIGSLLQGASIAVLEEAIGRISSLGLMLDDFFEELND